MLGITRTFGLWLNNLLGRLLFPLRTCLSRPIIPPVACCNLIDVLGPPLPDGPKGSTHVLVTQTFSNACGPSNTQEIICRGSRRLYMRGKHYRVAYEHGLDPNSIEGILCGNNPDHRTEVLKRVFAGCFGKRWWAEGEGIISGATYTISIQDERCIITTSSPTTPGVAIQPSLWWLRRVSIDELVRAELITPQVDKVYYNDGLYVYKSYPLYLESDMDLLKAVRISVRLQHSPYIINVHALVVHQKKCVGFLMPFAAMGSLLQARRNRVFSSWMRRRQFAHDIVRGVQALHSINEFHGDLNPRNVVLQFVPELEDRPRAQLIDLEANGGRTPPFMDPRLVNESEPSAQQDVHSTGKILLWLALDQLIDEDQWRRYDLPMELPEYIDPWFRNAIELCLDGGCTISELARIFEQNM